MKDVVSEPDCRKCGKCCEMLGYPPFLQQLEERGVHGGNEHPVDYLDMPEDIPAKLRREYQGYVAAVRAGRTIDRSGEKLPCFWWDAETKSCTHYQYRPRVCRAFSCGKARS